MVSASAAIALVCGLGLSASLMGQVDSTTGGRGLIGGAGAASASRSGSTWDEIAAAFGGAKSAAKTDPCRDVTMRFTFATEVAQIQVRGGERVKKGQLLAKARDTDILAAIEQQRIVAGSDNEIKGAKAAADYAEFRFDQYKRSGEFTPDEFERAKTEALTAKIQHEQALLNARSQKERLKQLEGQYERYLLNAPFDGIVENVLIEIGQGVGENIDAIRIVNTDQLWLDAYPETHETLTLELDRGSKAWVLVNLPERPALVEGKVLYVSPASDYVGQTRRVRVEIENAAGWPSGLQACVRFTEPAGEWEMYRVKGSGGKGGRMTSEKDENDTASQLAPPGAAPSKVARREETR